MFFTVLERSLSLAQHNFGTLLKTGWAYILLLVALNFAIGGSLMPESGFKTVSYMTEPVAAADEGALRALAAIANLLVGFSIAIAYVRRILIDARDFPVVVGRRTLRVIFFQIVLGLIGFLSLIPLIIAASIVAALTGGLGALLMVFAPFIALMVVQRFSVVLPAAAVDDPLTLKESWHATSGMGWAMAFAALIMSLLAGFLIFASGAFVLECERRTGAVRATLWQQIRSAIFPMGTMLILVWVVFQPARDFLRADPRALCRTTRVCDEEDYFAKCRRPKAGWQPGARARKALAGAQRVNRR